MATRWHSRAVLVSRLVCAAIIIGLANSAGANPPHVVANTAAVMQQLTKRPPSVQGSTQTHVGETPLFSIKGVGSNVGATPLTNASASLAPINPSPGGQPPTFLASVGQGPSPRIARGAG